MGDIHKEFFDNPIYSNGHKIRLVAFNKRYVLLPDTTDTRLHDRPKQNSRGAA
jgi:hypothetical protein